METRLCVIEENALAGFEAYMDEAGVSGKRCVVYDTNTYAARNLIRPAGDPSFPGPSPRQ